MTTGRFLMGRPVFYEDGIAFRTGGTDSAGAERGDRGIPSPNPGQRCRGEFRFSPPSTSGLLPPCKRPRVETLGSRGCICSFVNSPGSRATALVVLRGFRGVQRGRRGFHSGAPSGRCSPRESGELCEPWNPSSPLPLWAQRSAFPSATAETVLSLCEA